MNNGRIFRKKNSEILIPKSEIVRTFALPKIMGVIFSYANN